MLYTIYSNVPQLNIRHLNASIGKPYRVNTEKPSTGFLCGHTKVYYKTLLTDRKEKEQVFPAPEKASSQILFFVPTF